jgi:hypothetical protein
MWRGIGILHSEFGRQNHKAYEWSDQIQKEMAYGTAAFFSPIALISIYCSIILTCLTDQAIGNWRSTSSVLLSGRAVVCHGSRQGKSSHALSLSLSLSLWVRPSVHRREGAVHASCSLGSLQPVLFSEPTIFSSHVKSTAEQRWVVTLTQLLANG